MSSQVEVENFVLKMAAELPSRRDQLIFLINNYDMLLSVLMVRGPEELQPRPAQNYKQQNTVITHIDAI